MQPVNKLAQGLGAVADRVGALEDIAAVCAGGCGADKSHSDALAELPRYPPPRQYVLSVVDIHIRASDGSFCIQLNSSIATRTTYECPYLNRARAVADVMVDRSTYVGPERQPSEDQRSCWYHAGSVSIMRLRRCLSG